MSEKRYVIGVDFGTLSARALLIDGKTGQEIATAEMAYPHAVMDEMLPDGTKLPDRWALQHPADYTLCLRHVIAEVLREGEVAPEAVAGLGFDFTACTLLALDAEGVPLCLREEYKGEPHAYAKLWKHHAAQGQADRINEVAKARGEAFLALCGERVSSEWELPKILQMLEEAPELYAKTARFAEAADWLYELLCGEICTGAAFAGYKNLWSAENGYPSDAFYRALDPRLAGIVGDKIPARVRPVTDKGGVLHASGAALIGLPVGTPVALPMIDAHAAMPAVGAVAPGDLVMIIGTSACHILHGAQTEPVPGICGCVREAVAEGVTTFEAGQSAVGDIFAWFVDHLLPQRYAEMAKVRGISKHALLRELASALRVGESGLLALDWWNGNRSILDNADLSGMILGMTLQTRPEEIYRALLEATAFGSRVILEQYESGGLAVRNILAAGGIARKDPLMMQIYADVMGRELRVADTAQAGALGSAIYAAVAGGIYPSLARAAEALAAPCGTVYRPDPANHGVYSALYREYRALHSYFGEGGSAVMERLRSIAGK